MKRKKISSWTPNKLKNRLRWRLQKTKPLSRWLESMLLISHYGSEILFELTRYPKEYERLNSLDVFDLMDEFELINAWMELSNS